MTTFVNTAPRVSVREDRFFLYGAIAMAVVIVAGFSLQVANGRSSFASPPLVHAHAIVFMGWVTIYLLQNVFVVTGQTALHRRLGWLATGWIAAMLVLGTLVTVAMVRRGQVPFFFRPAHFLIFDPMTLIAFAGLTTAAVVMRRRTDWHRRLHFCGMALLVGPGFGRLLPVPLLMPWAWEASFAACLIFPLAGVIRDVRRDGVAHPAWGWGVGGMIAALLLIEAITVSPLGAGLYGLVTTGSPGATVAPLDFPAPPSR